jgi:hypothetical protein
MEEQKATELREGNKLITLCSLCLLLFKNRKNGRKDQDGFESGMYKAGIRNLEW